MDLDVRFERLGFMNWRWTFNATTRYRGGFDGFWFRWTARRHMRENIGWIRIQQIRFG